MAYEGPVWHIDPNIGYDNTDNGGEGSPLETPAYAISRIASLGFSEVAHILKLKKHTTPYGAIDATSLTPTSGNPFTLTSWDTLGSGKPEINGLISISSNMRVENFRLSSSNKAIGIGEADTSIDNVIVRGCEFLLTGSGVGITVGGANLTDFGDIDVLACTFVDKDSGNAIGVSIVWNAGATGCLASRIGNNILQDLAVGIQSSASIPGMVNSELTITNNCLYSNTSNQSNCPSPVNTVSSDPEFTDLSSNDLTLQETSPCIDAGLYIENCGSVDIKGDPRPIRNGWDIGANEYQFAILSQMVNGNTFPHGGGVEKDSFCNQDNLLALTEVNTDGNFSTATDWDRIITVYKHTLGERKVVSHRLVDGQWVGRIEFASGAELGAWEKREIIIVNKDSDGLSIGRSVFGSSEDLNLLT